MTEESIFNLIKDLCYHHLRDIRFKSSCKKHCSRLRSLSYETLFLFLNAEKIQVTSLNSYEKLLCHVSDLRIRGLTGDADRLDGLIEKLLPRHDKDEVFDIFTFLVALFNSSEKPRPSTESAATSSRTSRTTSSVPPWHDFAYACYTEEDFDMPSLEPPSGLLTLEDFEREPVSTYRDFGEMIAFDIRQLNGEEVQISEQTSITSHRGSTDDSGSCLDSDPWSEALKCNWSRRLTWEEVGRRNPPRELPYLTESSEAIRHLLDLMGSLSPSDSREIPAFDDSAREEVVKLLLGVPSTLYRKGEGEEEQFKCQSKVLTGLCREFYEVGSCFNELSGFCSDFSGGHGSLCSALCEAIHSYLVLYHSVVMIAGRDCGTFSEVSYKFRGFFKQIRFLARLCTFDRSESDDSASPPKGPLLLSHLYDRCIDVENDDDLRPLMFHLFRCTCIPYFRMLEEWIYMGRCSGEEGRMIVRLDPQAASARDESFWLRSTLAPLEVPNFLKDIYGVILSCGKSINLLRMCSNEHFSEILSRCARHPPIGLVFTRESSRRHLAMHEEYRGAFLRSTSDPRKGDELPVVERSAEEQTEESLRDSEPRPPPPPSNHVTFGADDTRPGNEAASEPTLVRAVGRDPPEEEGESALEVQLATPAQNQDDEEEGEKEEEDDEEEDEKEEDEKEEELRTPDLFRARSTPGYIPRRKLVDGLPADGLCAVPRPHIKSVSGAHPSVTSGGFPLECAAARRSLSAAAPESPDETPRRGERESEGEEATPCQDSPDKSHSSESFPDESHSSESFPDESHSSESFPDKSHSSESTSASSSGYSSTVGDADLLFSRLEVDIVAGIGAADFMKRGGGVGDPTRREGEEEEEEEENIGDLRRDTGNFPLGLWLRDCLASSVAIQSRLVDRFLVDFFLGVVGISGHFEVLQRFVLLQDAQFAFSLVEALSRSGGIGGGGTDPSSAAGEGLGNPRGAFGRLGPSHLNSILHRALASTSLPSSSDRCLTDRLTFTFATAVAGDPLAPLRLTLVPGWPACVVVRNGHLEVYGRLFAFLFKLKRTLWCVREIFARLKRDATVFLGGRHRNPQFQLLHLYRHEMQHLVGSVHDYVSDQVLVASWQEFRGRLPTSSSSSSPFFSFASIASPPSGASAFAGVERLDDLVALHSRFVGECLSRCLLDDRSSSVASIIDALFDHVIFFHSQLKSESWLSVDEEEDEEEGEDGKEGSKRDRVFHPKFKVLVDVHRKFQQCYSFLRKILARLEQKSPHLTELMLRLEFNLSSNFD